MEYRYRLTEQEATKEYIYTYLERTWWMNLIFVFMLVCIWRIGASGRFVAVFCVVSYFCRTAKNIQKRKQDRATARGERHLRIEDGCILLIGAFGWECYSCGDLIKIARRGQNHRIKIRVPGQSRQWVAWMVPFRVTGSCEERKAFVQNLRSQCRQMRQMQPDEIQQRILDVQARQEQWSWGTVDADYTVEYVWEEQEFKRYRGQLQNVLGKTSLLFPFVDFRNQQMAEWKIRFTGEAVLVNSYFSRFYRPWESMNMLLETSELFVLRAKDDRFDVFFPKSVIGCEEDWRKFCEYCKAHGLEYAANTLVVEEKPEQKKNAAFWKLSVAVVTAGVILTTCMEQFEHYAVAEVTEEEDVFRPEYYPDYQPLEKQVEVLKSLGFQISPEVAQNLAESMEEWPDSRVWIEGYPYYSLLTNLGCPERDYETWEVTEFSDQAYWFDWEGFDLSTDYIEIINGVNALSGGEFSLTEPAEYTDKVDWEEGTGTLKVTFLLNGIPYECNVKVEHDWLNEEILTGIGEALEKENVPGHLYAMGDSGQGCILLYRDEAWAEEFEKKTGIALKTPSLTPQSPVSPDSRTQSVQ